MATPDLPWWRLAVEWQLWRPALRDVGDCPLLVQITVRSLHTGAHRWDLFVGLALFFSYPHHLPPLTSSPPSFNPNAGGPKMGVPAEEFGSWKNSGRRRIWKSGRGNSLPAERQSWVHNRGRENAERYLSRQHTRLALPCTPMGAPGVDEATQQHRRWRCAGTTSGASRFLFFFFF